LLEKDKKLLYKVENPTGFQDVIGERWRREMALKAPCTAPVEKDHIESEVEVSG
jgi:hypothetical protein